MTGAFYIWRTGCGWRFAVSEMIGSRRALPLVLSHQSVRPTLLRVVRARARSAVASRNGILSMALSRALLFAALTRVVYIALEPFLRRRWLHVLVSWTRLL